MTTLSLPRSRRGGRRRALVLAGGAMLLLAGLGTRAWLPTDGADRVGTSPVAVDSPLFVLPPQPADSSTTPATTPVRPEALWERSLRDARHPEP
jgi:hypothetical protein